MLSLLIGSSTHSFELMLSAFIMGLALGGLAIRRRADQSSDPLALLGWIQITMGGLALISLLLYPLLFHVLAKILQVMPKTPAGYNGLLAVHFLIANVIMLPTTLCAGMTLPLLTRKLMRSGGERAIGAIYATNTLGSIAAVILAGFFLLPVLGLKTTFIIGALIDLVLGLVLLAVALPIALRRAVPIALVALIAVLSMEWHPALLSSGVYRSGQFDLAGLTTNRQILFHRDGRTASVSVIEITEELPSSSTMAWLKTTDQSEEKKLDHRRTISTNGKPDAALYYTPLHQEGDDLPAMTPDETTMVFLGTLPLMVKPDARLAVNIGFGSGLSTRMLLLSPQIQRVDTVEIEEMMIEGAHLLGSRVEEAFTDPRSRIIIDDAKSFSQRHRISTTSWFQSRPIHG